jgi:hypothetical protein
MQMHLENELVNTVSWVFRGTHDAYQTPLRCVGAVSHPIGFGQEISGSCLVGMWHFAYHLETLSRRSFWRTDSIHTTRGEARADRDLQAQRIARQAVLVFCGALPFFRIQWHDPQHRGLSAETCEWRTVGDRLMRRSIHPFLHQVLLPMSVPMASSRGILPGRYGCKSNGISW